MFRLLAAKAVISNPQRYGFLLKREHLYPVIPHTEVNVTTSIDNLAQFAKSKGITYAQLKDANPWLRDSSYKTKADVHTFLKYRHRRECTMIRRRRCRIIRHGL